MVGIQYGGNWPSIPAALPLPDLSPLRCSEKRIVTPPRMTDDLAFLLGAYFSEGHTTASNWSVILTNSVDSVLFKAQEAYADVFGLTARITRQKDRCPGLVVSSRRLVLWMRELGCGSRASDKRVPSVIALGTREHALRFLQGAALDAYTTCSHAGKWAICLDSQPGIDDLQDLLTRLGIANAQILKRNKLNGKSYPELYAAGPAGQHLSKLVPFLEPDKESAAAVYRSKVYMQRDRDVIPGITGPELYASLPLSGSGRGVGSPRHRFRHLLDARTAHVTRHSVCLAADAGARLPPWLLHVLDPPVRFASAR